MNAGYQYLEHLMNWRSGFVDIRVTRYMGVAIRAAADETVQKQKASPWQREPLFISYYFIL